MKHTKYWVMKRLKGNTIRLGMVEVKQELSFTSKTLNKLDHQIIIIMGMEDLDPIDSKATRLTELNRSLIITNMRKIIQKIIIKDIHQVSIKMIWVSMNTIKEGWNKSLVCI